MKLKKMKLAIFAMVLILGLSACSNVKPTGNAVLGAEVSADSTNAPTAIAETSQIQDFYGKPSVIFFASTGCPHCRKAVPDYQTKIYEQYDDKINVWLNVVNGRKFSTTIPQGLNRNLRFDNIAGTNCAYVPSWVVLDSEGKPVLSSCGNTRSLDELSSALKDLLQ